MKIVNWREPKTDPCGISKSAFRKSLKADLTLFLCSIFLR